MDQNTDMGRIVIDSLSKKYNLNKLDVGSDARLAKKGMVFTTESYDVAGVGRLCVLRMRAMLGIMKMETVVLSVFNKDMPLFNADWVKAAGNETRIVELYDTQLSPYSGKLLGRLDEISKRDSDLKDYKSTAPHWYDSIRYSCSYAKTGKKVSDRLYESAKDCISAYIDDLITAESCDERAKREKVREFAVNLYNNGGPAVDQIKKLFGEETAKRLILRHMYGVDE